MADLIDSIKISDGFDTPQRLTSVFQKSIDQAIQSYESLVSLPISDTDPKVHAAHHSACKAALAHLEMLLKLSKTWGTSSETTETISSSSEDESQFTDFAKMLLAAQKTLDSYEHDDTTQHDPNSI